MVNNNIPKLNFGTLSRTSSRRLRDFFKSPRKSEVISDPTRKLFIQKTKGNQRFVITDDPLDNFQDFSAIIQDDYLSGKRTYKFFEKLINVSLGDEGDEAAKRVYDMIPGYKKINFISQLNRAQLRKELLRENIKDSQGSLCRQSGLSSKLFSIHFLNHCESQLKEITQNVLEYLKKEFEKLGSLELSSEKVKLSPDERKAREGVITKAVEDVFDGTFKFTQRLPYEVKQLFHHLYEDCLEFSNQDTARQQVLGRIFLRIISPRLTDSPLHNTIIDANLRSSFRSATAKVSKIIQHHANQTELDSVKIPDQLKFAFKKSNYNEQISRIIENVLFIKKIKSKHELLDNLAKTEVSEDDVKDVARYIYESIPDKEKCDFILRLYAADKDQLFKKTFLLTEIITIHIGFLLEDTLQYVTKIALDQLQSLTKEESFKESKEEHQDAVLKAIDSIFESAGQIPKGNIHPEIKKIFGQLKEGCNNLSSHKMASLFFLGLFNQMPVIRFKERYISDEQHLDRFKEAVFALNDAIIATVRGKKHSEELKIREFVTKTKQGAILKIFNNFISDSNINKN